jgi:hypothetical protein
MKNVSQHLPPEAVAVLVQAANEAKVIADQAKRDARIDSAIAHVRMQYPQYFKE